MSNYNIGDSASTTKIFSQDEVTYYCTKLSGDDNPIHYNQEAAKANGFERCLVPGIMVTSLFGGLLGSKLPGKGTIHLGQTAKFLKPVFIDEQIRVVITIKSIREDKPILTFSTIIIKENDEIAIEGDAVVKYRL